VDAPSDAWYCPALNCSAAVWASSLTWPPPDAIGAGGASGGLKQRRLEVHIHLIYFFGFIRFSDQKSIRTNRKVQS
jgi:hypothetical protein